MQPTITSTDKTIPSPARRPFAALTEDWWAVLLGGAIIFAVLILNGNGVAFHLPAYQWSSADELPDKVLSGENLLRILETGVIFLALASFSVVLAGESILRFAAGFAVVFLLVVIS
ncbi:MAG TPA: hypothetical protein VHC48_05180, partial [Puia sp.]|nr:hypothetical protein [Puia sp.]